MKQLTVCLLLSVLLMAACVPAGPSADSVATTVAATLTALAPTPVPPPLPRALYFLAPDASDIAQIFRLERDALTRSQMTFEPAAVDEFDVSPLDGALAYVSNNQLYGSDANGGGRRLILDGGPAEQTADFMSFRMVSHPTWSPDGKTLAFGYNGINLFDPAAGSTVNLLQNTTQSPSGNPYLRSRYSPISFSPDGTRLLVEIGWYEGGSMGVLHLGTKQLVQFGEGIICCEGTWAPDGSAVLVGSQYACYVRPGLWRYDAATGAGADLLPSQNPDGTNNFAAAPFIAPDGQLYYFYAAGYPVMECGSGPLQAVRSAVDGLMGRTGIYPASMEIGEALWFPDASGAVVVRPSAVNLGEQETVLLRFDGAPEMSLGGDLSQLSWGP